MNWFEIMRGLDQHRLRQHKGCYTLGFTEGRHRYCFHRHDTGQHIKIYVVDGDKELHVFESTEWFSSRYHFNGFGRGWIHQGPWVDAIKQDFAKFEAEITKHAAYLENKAAAAKQAAAEHESSELASFAALYN